MLCKVISGGQTGVDQAALAAAKLVGLETGGVLPYGCRTLDGPRPDLKELYGMDEHTSASYAVRTIRNVRDSDSTLRIATNWNSAGELCTLAAINEHEKPHLDLCPLQNGEGWGRIVAFIEKHNIEVLNVAGNSEQTSPGIYDLAYRMLVEAFLHLKGNRI